MKLEKYLVIGSNGTTKITANKPSLKVNEIAIQLNIDVPDQLFKKPMLVADINVDENLSSQEIISTEVIDNAKELVSNALGLELRIKTVEQQDETLV